MRVAARRDPRQQPYLGPHPAGPDDPPQRGGQRVVPDEGGRPGRIDPRRARPGGGPSVQQVRDAHGLYGDARVQRGLERGAPEGALGASAPGGALGEDGDPVAVEEGPGDGRDGVGEGSDPIAFDEQGAVLAGERTEDGPGPDVALGEHPAGCDGGDERDVEPRDVVGDDQAAAVGAGAPVHGEPDAEGPYESGRPGPDERLPGPLGQQPDRLGAQDPEQDHGDGGNEPRGRVRDARDPPLVAGAGRGGAGRGGQPDAHAPGVSERKCLR
ncbi:hypothetical protein GCM10010336_19910 [Streptomyces goshikiensis]|nr:hypothetical protein GCM10010336_19910 [Streptomyces goshikiensis]